MSERQKIEFQNFHFKYKRNQVLKNINLKIEEGEKVIITGENGCGKSTLLKILGKAIPLKKHKYENTFKNTFYLTDKFRLIKNEKVTEFLRDIAKFYREEREIDKLLEKVELNNIKIKNLSKGNRQKLGILTAIVANRELNLIDEVFDGVDQNNKENILELIKESNKTFLIITHEPEIFKEFRHLKIKNGEIECIN